MIPWDPSTRELRQFSAVSALVFGGLAGLLVMRGGSSAATGILAALAFAPGLLGIVRPPVVRLPYLVLLALVRPISLVLSTVVLWVLYFGILTPTGLALRLARRDPLDLRRRDAKSYWQPRPPPPDAESYLRQS